MILSAYIHGVSASSAARLCVSVLAALFFLCLQACSLFRPWVEGPAAVLPGVCRSGDTKRDLQVVGAAITGIEARARIQLTVRGTRQPSVRCALKWRHSAEGERLRATGSGPFGITIFDALIRDNLFLLYIPSHDAVYFADIEQDGVHGRDMNSIAMQARMVLNPWEAVAAPDTREVLCQAFPDLNNLPDDCVCYASLQGTGRTLAVFSSRTLSPAVLETGSCSVQFSGLVEGSDSSLPCVRYPSRILIFLKSLDLQLDIKIADAEFNGVPANDPAFDTLPFMTMRVLPLKLLTGPGSLP